MTLHFPPLSTGAGPCPPYTRIIASLTPSQPEAGCHVLPVWRPSASAGPGAGPCCSWDRSGTDPRPGGGPAGAGRRGGGGGGQPRWTVLAYHSHLHSWTTCFGLLPVKNLEDKISRK